MKDNAIALPVIPLRGVSVFPGNYLNFDLERSFSINAATFSMKTNQQIFLLIQKDMSVDMPEEDDLYSVGVVCKIKQMIRLPGNLIRLIVQGMYRAQSNGLINRDSTFFSVAEKLEEKAGRISIEKKEALCRHTVNLFNEYITLNPQLPNELILNLSDTDDVFYISDYIAHNLQIDTDFKQEFIEQKDPVKRLSRLAECLKEENILLTIESEISHKTQDNINDEQRDYYLRQELKAIQTELGEGDQFDDISEYREKIEKLPISAEIKDKLQKDVSRLSKQPFGSSDASVIRNYLDTCLEIPWGVESEDNVNIKAIRKTLNKDHFGLDKVKERIIEYFAVKQLAPDVKSSILCLVGPPGTGKTSISMSIANATNRKLARISLGGLHDEAEIRGHRKTYVGAMPGRIISGLIQAGTCNPVMVLDEIDKVGTDYRGDPSSALLEVLDPEQNSCFRDNFLEIPFDLSKVLFITTANSLDTIPAPLLDRMEIIEVPSYTDEEKLQIAKKHLLPKQMLNHGLTADMLKISDSALRSIIESYTRESGVRTLEREISVVCRKAAALISEKEADKVAVSGKNLEKYLGVPKFKRDSVLNTAQIGLVHGLAYTSTGGEVLDVEAAVTDGSGRLELTGNLGDVMKESCKAAITYIRSNSEKLGVASDFYKDKDIHLHFPEGAVPKDGPSAGIAISVALISALTGRKIRPDITMTGEITLRGRVLPIGGLREKTMASLRCGIKNVIIPAENIPDLEEIDQKVRFQLNFIPVSHLDEVRDIVFSNE